MNIYHTSLPFEVEAMRAYCFTQFKKTAHLALYLALIGTLVGLTAGMSTSNILEGLKIGAISGGSAGGLFLLASGYRQYKVVREFEQSKMLEATFRQYINREGFMLLNPIEEES